VPDRASEAVTVVIVSHRSTSVLQGAIGSALVQLPGCEVVVVENGLAPEEVGRHRAAYEGAARVLCVANDGFGAACNAGAARAARPFVLFLNPDARLSWVDVPALDAAMARDRLGIAGVGTVSQNGRPVNPLRRDRSWRTEIPIFLTNCLLKPGWLAQLPLEHLVGHEPPWASAAVMLVRRKEFEAVGGFDERLFLYHEDRDLSRRYARDGYPIERLTGLLALHASQGGSDMPMTRRIACSLVSAVEMAEMWEESGLPAARAVVRGLSAVERATGVPTIAGRAVLRSKSAQARGIRQAIATVLASRPPSQYPVAREAFGRLDGLAPDASASAGP
jgi:N-acetylglucosaminyl-diphospho-decaprenol L-rhamnosyltransferase